MSALVSIVPAAPSADIGPGLGAFISFFTLAVALWLLMRNMNSRLRRMSYRNRELEEAEQAAEVEPEPTAEQVSDADEQTRSRSGRAEL